jgi:hypothetical protein
VTRIFSADEKDIANSMARSSGAYVELGPNSALPNTWKKPFIQSLGGIAGQSGRAGFSHVSACRMGDMRQAVCLASSDGGGGYNAVTVRIQVGTEALGFPNEVMRTTAAIKGVRICAPQNPVYNTGRRMALDGTLIVAVWLAGSPSVRLYISTNFGKSWVQFWQTDGDGTYVQDPKILFNALNWNFTMAYRDTAASELRARESIVDPALFTTSFAWLTPPETMKTGVVESSTSKWVYDLWHDKGGWVLGYVNSLDIGGGYWECDKTVGLNPNLAPNALFSYFVYGYAVGASQVPTYCAVARTGPPTHDDRAGNRVMFLDNTSGQLTQILWLEDMSATEFPISVFQQEFWAEDYGGFYSYFDPVYELTLQAPRLENRKWWLSRRTPSTSLTYEQQSWMGYTDYVAILDNHGPTPTDNDVADNFGGFWTRSNETDSAAFPPKDGRDLVIEFALKFHKSAYHNMWFVVEDPLNPGVPIFRIDYYVGHGSSGGHPHDTARGCRIWFCRRMYTPDHAIKNTTAGEGSFPTPYQHPLDWCFDGYDNNADNAGPWFFRIEYTASDDKFRLKWKTTPSGSWVPFVPYAASHPSDTREYIDVFVPDPLNPTVDQYVASTTEKYHTVDAGDLWPRRFYVGCPEVKPAIQEQSGITLGYLFVNSVASYTDYCHTAGAFQIIPRMSGGLDLWWVDSDGAGDVVKRSPWGYRMQDGYTAVSMRSTWAADGGPDQAELVLEDIDNNNRRSVYGTNLRNYWVYSYARGGSIDRTNAAFGKWTPWVCHFFGVSDTGVPTDSGEGPRVTLRCFNPLRDATRSYASQSFTSLPPPKQTDPTTGDPIEPAVKDEKKVRESQVIYLTDFDHPCDPTLQIWDDTLAGYVWEQMLGQDLERLLIPRVGLKPTNFTVNSAGGDNDIWEDMRKFWQQLGLSWFYNYFSDYVNDWGKRGTLEAIVLGRLWAAGNIEATADITLDSWATLSAPLERQEDDWGRAGNVLATTSNMEQRPNTTVARVAAWPDAGGGNVIEEQVEVVSGLASQQAIAEMYAKDIPLKALYREWLGSRSVQAVVHAFPLFQPFHKVWIEVDNPATTAQFRQVLTERFGSLVRVWLVRAVETQWDRKGLTQTLTLVDPGIFPASTRGG